MKRNFTLLAMLLVLAMAFNAYAASEVQVTLTSPAIVKQGCERFGTLKFTFKGGSTISAGDWWYFDLDQGVTVCKNIDYFMGVGTVATPGNAADTITKAAIANTVTVGGGMTGVTTRTVAQQGTEGPFSFQNPGNGAGNIVTVPAGAIFFNVKADVGSRRVWVYVYGLNITDTMTVETTGTFSINVLDGQSHQQYIVTDLNLPAGTHTYGDHISETINQAGTLMAPFVENTFCADASAVGSSKIYLSYDALNGLFNFTGDSEIAHVVSATTFSLDVCGKDPKNYTYIEKGAQAKCLFNMHTFVGYCGTSGITAQRNFLLISTEPLGDPGDRYTVKLTSDTPGVYFGGAGITTDAYPTKTDACAKTNLITPSGTAFTGYNESNQAVVTFPTASCSVAATQRVRRLETVNGAVTGVHNARVLEFSSVPDFVYDTTILQNNTEVKISVTISKYPCGGGITLTKTLGTYVETCPATGTTGSTTLLFPYFPPMDDSYAPWWGGLVIVNASSTAGDAMMTFMEEPESGQAKGDMATLTVNVKAMSMYNAGLVTSLLNSVTPDSANTGTFGNNNVAVKVECKFDLGGGFAFLGNSKEGVGYTAYTLVSGSWH